MIAVMVRPGLLSLLSVFVMIAAINQSTNINSVFADHAAAKKHFKKGRKLLAAKKYAKACKEFSLSRREEVSVGALLNLGECNRLQNKLASAWRAFKAAEYQARLRNRPDRVAHALTLIKELEPRLSFVEIVVGDRLTELESLRVSLDGQTVPEREFNQATAIDAGDHVVEASSPGHNSFRKAFAIKSDGSSKRIIVRLTRVLRATPARNDRGWLSSRNIGKGLFAGAVSSVAVGAFFGLSARQRWSEAEKCKDMPPCRPQDAALVDSATARAHISTGAFLFAVAAAAGGYLLFTKEEKTPSRVVVGPGNVSVIVHF